ncbi:MAG: hypothetical protein KDB37_02195, partial [Ilumatobacter sp.]|nr:hypothetical protein [Ilumatobacter sp.]
MYEHAPGATSRAWTGLTLVVAILVTATMALVAPASVSAATETSGGLLETATGSTSGPTAGDVVSLVPERLVETRSGPGDVTTDGAFQGIGR